MHLDSFQVITELQKWINSLKQEMDGVKEELIATLTDKKTLIGHSREAQARLVLRGVEQRIAEVNEMYKILLDKIAEP